MLIFILIIMIVYSFIIKKIVSKNKMQYIYYRDIPSKDSPAIVGKLVKGHTDGNDIIATILTLVNKGYIGIEKEKVRGKEKTVLYLEKNAKILELKEYEMFLINQIFKENDRIVFEEYIKSNTFKQNFKTFDEMLDRRMKTKKVYKTSLLKNINKIVLLVSYFIFGLSLFYSIITPITIGINNMIKLNTQTVISITLMIAGIIYVFVAYQYDSFINKRTNAYENINLNIAYLILCVLLGVFLIFSKGINLYSILDEELVWYKISINFILSITTLLYMFHVIKHTRKQEYIYYIFVMISILTMIFDMKLGMGICILFLATYVFFKTPKHTHLKQEEDLYKWIGFKSYLEDYSMLSQQDSNAIIIWETYLTYAIALGVNKKIVKKYAQLNHTDWLNEIYLKNIYVEYFE